MVPEDVKKRIAARLEDLKDNDQFIEIAAALIDENEKFKRYMRDQYRKDIKKRPYNVISAFQCIADLGHGIANYIQP